MTEKQRQGLLKANTGKNHRDYRHDVSNNDIIRLRNEGLSYSKIENILNCSATLVIKRCKKLAGV